MDIMFPDVFGVGRNSRGVNYLYNIYDGDVVAKVCTRCGEWHFLNGFNKAGKGFAGTHSLCRFCHAERGAEYREELRDSKYKESFNTLISSSFAMAVQQEIRSHEKRVRSTVFNRR